MTVYLYWYIGLEVWLFFDQIYVWLQYCCVIVLRMRDPTTILQDMWHHYMVITYQLLIGTAVSLTAELWPLTSTIVPSFRRVPVPTVAHARGEAAV